MTDKPQMRQIQWFTEHIGSERYSDNSLMKYQLAFRLVKEVFTVLVFFKLKPHKISGLRHFQGGEIYLNF